MKENLITANEFVATRETGREEDGASPLLNENIGDKDHIDIQSDGDSHQDGNLPFKPSRNSARRKRLSALEDRILCVHLDGIYDKSAGFNDLEGTDRRMALLLQNCSAVEVFLATMVYRRIKQYRCDCEAYSDDEFDAEEVESCELHGIVDSSDRLVNLNLESNWKSHFSGIIKTLNYSSTHNLKFLIVWPKQDSLKFYCRFGLSSLIGRMESSFRSTCSNTRGRERLNEELRDLVTALSQETPSLTQSQNYNFYSRLLRQCTRLQACHEGLEVLKMLAQNLGNKLP